MRQIVYMPLADVAVAAGCQLGPALHFARKFYGQIVVTSAPLKFTFNDHIGL